MSEHAFPTHGVLSVSADILMGDISAVYEVISFLIGRSAFTHEIALYGKRAQRALRFAHPELPTEVTPETWSKVRDAFIAKHGTAFVLSDALAGCLADDKSPVDTMKAMMR